MRILLLALLALLALLPVFFHAGLWQKLLESDLESCTFLLCYILICATFVQLMLVWQIVGSIVILEDWCH